jgi:hypothetical protein
MELFNKANNNFNKSKASSTNQSVRTGTASRTTNQSEQTSTTTYTMTTVEPPESIITNTSNKFKHMNCCACGSTNTNNKSLTFCKIPVTTIQVTDFAKNHKRLKYAKQQLRRKIYLQRFGLPLTNTNQKYLTFCSKHKLQLESFEASYKSTEGFRITTSEKLVFPKDMTASEISSTRANRMLIHSLPPKRKKPNNNTPEEIVVINTIGTTEATPKEPEDNTTDSDSLFEDNTTTDYSLVKKTKKTY